MTLPADATSAWCRSEIRPRSGTCQGLLLRQRDRELAVADARRDTFDKFRDRVLAIGADQLGQRGEQARLREAVAVDAVMARVRPGLVEIAERGLLLLLIRQGIAGKGEGNRAHELNRQNGAITLAERVGRAWCS